MNDDLQVLIEVAQRYEMTPEEKEKQRRSFAFGNANIENDRVTQDTINREADYMKAHDV